MQKPKQFLHCSLTSLLLLLLLLLICSHVCCQDPTSTPTLTHPTNTLSSLPHPITPTKARGRGTIAPTWIDSFVRRTHGLGNLIFEDPDSPAVMVELASRLPGIFQGLSEGLKGSDVGEVLANLFADPRTKATPAWIEALLKGSNSSSLSQVRQSAAAQQLLQTFAQQSSSEQMQTMLSHMFSDVAKALNSLSLSYNSSVHVIISAILSDTSLMSSLSSAGQTMLGSLASQAGLEKKFQETPIRLLPAVSPQCGVDLGLLAQGLQNGEWWALSMIDAMGKIPVGVLEKRNVLFGDFNQCLRISHTVQTHTVKGLFCGMAIKVPSPLQVARVMSGILLHVCLPSSCDEYDRYQLMNPLLQPIGSQYYGQYCHRWRDPLGDDAFIGAVIAFTVLGALCTLSTLYGVYLDHQAEKKKKEEMKLPPDTSATINVNQAYDPDSTSNGVHMIPPSTSGQACNIDDDITAISTNEKEESINGEEERKSTSDCSSVVLAGDPAVNVENRNQSAPVCQENQSETVLQGSQSEPACQEVVFPENQSAPVSQHPVSPSKPDSVLSKILEGFSVLKNGSRVLSCAQNPSDISCLHGIRVLSIMWIILCHCFTQLHDAQDKPKALDPWLQYFIYTISPGALLAVDTFFLLSGCLTTFMFLKSMKKSGLTPGVLILYYVHRIWRLIPMHAMILVYYIGIFPYTKRGPFENFLGMDSEHNCRKYWHFNILHINNLVDASKICFGWSWYLSNDLQFSVIAPIVLIPWVLKGSLRRVGQIVGWLLALSLILVHSVTTGVISYQHDLSMFTNGYSFMVKIYIKPWCRVGPYAVGLLLGYILHHTPRSYRMAKPAVFLGWVMGLGLGLTLMYVNNDNMKDIMIHGVHWNAAETAAFEALKKWLWAISVGWVIFACYTGYGGVINSLLSWRAWLPLSRLTYGVYLIHLVVLYTLTGNCMTWIHSDVWTWMELFLAVTVLSYLVSFIFSMLVEVPTRDLEKVVLGKIFKKKND